MTFATNNVFKLYFNKTIQVIFTMRTELVSFNEITNAVEFWDFMEKDFLNSLHIFLLKWEEKSVPVNFSASNDNYVVGPPRIRQIRIKPTLCPGDSFYQTNFRECYGLFTPQDEDIRDHFKGTKYYTPTQAGYHTNIDLDFNYHSGGYTENLDFKKAENRKIIKKLRDSEWIDRGTRLVIVEMAFFNANLKLFCEAK